jgi:hypothetical protein
MSKQHTVLRLASSTIVSASLRHCDHHLSAMQPLARCLTPWLRWTRAPLFAALGLPPPSRRGRPELDFGGAVACYTSLQYTLLGCLYES